MAYTDLSFCWHGIVHPDTAAARDFYTGALGWNAQSMAMSNGDTTVLDPGDGVPRLHLTAPPEAGVPPHWQSFLRVEDVDAATAKAVEAGGAQIVPPTDIDPGRFSMVASPSGAVVALYREADASSADAPAGAGIHWTELHSHELAKDLAWLKAAFGLSTQKMPMPDGSDYFILQQGERQVGGAMTAQNEGAPSMWLVWVRVDDVDATARKVTASGGSLLGDRMDLPGIGAMFVAADPAGGVFGIIQPATA